MTREDRLVILTAALISSPSKSRSAIDEALIYLETIEDEMSERNEKDATLSPISVDAIVQMERARCAMFVERLLSMRAPGVTISQMEIKEVLADIWQSHSRE